MKIITKKPKEVKIVKSTQEVTLDVRTIQGDYEITFEDKEKEVQHFFIREPWISPERGHDSLNLQNERWPVPVVDTVYRH